MVLPDFLQKRLDAKNALIAKTKVEDVKPVIETQAKIKKGVKKKVDLEEENSEDEDSIKPTKIFKNLSKYLIK